MKNLFVIIRNNYSNIYKGLLFLFSITILVLVFPKEGQFKYEFKKGSPWLHEDLIATFDFAVTKTDTELKAEKELALSSIKPYFEFKFEIVGQQRAKLLDDFQKRWSEKYKDKRRFNKLKPINITLCTAIFDTIFNRGIIEFDPEIENKEADFTINLIKNRVSKEVELSEIFNISSAVDYLKSELKKSEETDNELLKNLLENSLIHNIKYDHKSTQRESDNVENNISLTRGAVQPGQRIISKGELVTNEKFRILESLKVEYETRLGSSSKQYLIVIGQIFLISISIVVLILFLLAFKKDVFLDNKMLVMILSSVIFMVIITSLVVKYQVNFLYLVPICIVPIIIRAFFDTRLALFVHLVTIIIIGFLVPNSFEFVFLQLIAGIIAIISVKNLEKRAQFFLTSILIFITYSTIYVGLSLIQEGSFDGVDLFFLALFAGSSILTLFSFPLIFIFEKFFGYVTDISLMELSHTKSRLLRELALNAPGTFQHSMQVANLAEEAVYEIGGNALLVRTGALYHDIGKIDMPIYFIENQTSGINPHDEMTYEESAKMITSHIIKGIEKAKKNKIPEEIIDFIRTHHGTRKTGYFYAKHKAENTGNRIDEDIFTYKGPIPFSKETSIVMMADSVEAASRSLKQYDEESINKLVDNIIDSQVATGQFINADITHRDVSVIKKIFKKKLLNIYHIRIAYPDK